MMERVETKPADVRCFGLSPLEPDMEAYSAGSTKNFFKHDEEKPHAAGSKTQKKRKKVPKKLKDDENEPHAAGPKKKKALLPDRTLPEEEEEPAWNPDLFDEMLKEMPEVECKTVKLKLDKYTVKHFEEYTPPLPYNPRDLDFMHPDVDPYSAIVARRAAARHNAWLERCNRAVQQFKEYGSAELEMESFDSDQVEDLLNEVDEINRLIEEA